MYEGFFYDFSVMDYIPKVLKNIALDAGNMITKSIPLGYLRNFDTMFSPQRFMEQIMAFEYLFEKIDHKKAADKKFPLKEELAKMIDEFPDLLGNTKITSSEVSDHIKSIRNNIAHGHAYYYDFKNDPKEQYYMLLLDRLLKKMSLLVIGFSKVEIARFPMI